MFLIKRYMNRIISSLVIASCILCSCGSGNVTPVAFMMRPHETLPDSFASDGSCLKIFLAGTIDMGQGRDWQQEVYERFSEMDGRYILFNPRQTEWDASRPGEMDYQVCWELEHLEKADIVIMYIIGSSRSPISLLEMGLHARGGKLYVACEPGYYRYDNVRITCDFYDVPLYDSLDSLINALPL